MSEEAKQNAWAEHYERLLNVKFEWDPDYLSNESPLEGPPIPITIDMVKKAISKMKWGRAAGPSGIVEEVIKSAGETGATMIRDLATAIISDGKVPTAWELSKEGCKDQESIQSSTTPDPGYQWESDKLTVDITNESQVVSLFPAGDHKAHINRRAQRQSKHKTEQKHKRSTKEVPPWNGQ